MWISWQVIGESKISTQSEQTRLIRNQKDLQRLRRIALAHQGLNRQAPFGRGLSGARKTIEHLGYVQLDTISVVERAHHHVFRSRVPNFTPEMGHKLLQQRSVFEYWAHAAALLPMDDYRFTLPYKAAIKAGKVHWYKNPDKPLMRKILRRIQEHGPLRSRDLEDSRTQRGGWWEWKPAKRAIEQLYFQGDLMVTEREGFQKTYDLPERVLPDSIDTSMPTTQAYAEHIIQRQFRAHGLLTLKGITYLRRDKALREAVKLQVANALENHSLLPLRLQGGQIFYIEPEVWETTSPRTDRLVRILSPFDNLVIQRERLNNLFNFDYQIECYVPEDKRRYGYFCLPLLYRDHLVGRMDCKAHRSKQMFEIKSLHLNDHPFQPAELAAALAEALTNFLEFQQCVNIELTNVRPVEFHQQLSGGLRDAGFEC